MTVKRSKIFKVSAVCMTVIFAFMASAMPALCANEIPDPVTSEDWHEPSENVVSIYDVNFPGFESGIYISAAARSSANLQLYHTNFAPQANNQSFSYCYSGISIYSFDSQLDRGYYSNLSYRHWTTSFSRDETDIEFRINIPDIDPTIERYIYIWVSGYSEFQMNTALASWYGTHETVLKEMKLEYMKFSEARSSGFFSLSGAYHDVKAYDSDGQLLPKSFYGVTNHDHFPMDYGLCDAWVIRISIPSTVPDSGELGITFFNVYQGYDIDWNLFDEITDIPDWMPGQLINLFTWFFTQSPYLSYCLIVVSLGLITCGVIKLAG